jgi:G:T/U-mismatch repair DNA glycosylase
MREAHPYGVFIPPHPESMIIGSFPIGKFSDPKRRHEIKKHEFDFFFGGEKNLLWKLLGAVFKTPVTTRNEIKKMLKTHHLAIGDVIESCKRKSGGASDTDLYDIHWNYELYSIIRKRKIQKVYFTSRKVETWFNRLFPESHDLIKVTLISPSAQSFRSITRRDDFKQWQMLHPHEEKFHYLLNDYRKKFETSL